MKHRGEIVEKAIRYSGFSITRLAERIGYSRRQIYNFFNNANLSIEIVLEIGKVLHYDFSNDFPEIAHPPVQYKVDLPRAIHSVSDPLEKYGSNSENLYNEISLLKDIIREKEQLIKEKDRVIKMQEDEIRRLRRIQK